jgi:ABC-type lipoprotein export system ATPase subunit
VPDPRRRRLSAPAPGIRASAPENRTISGRGSNDPDVLLCDEPTGELDGAAAERGLVLLRQRAAAGAAVVVVTHSERVARDADRVLALRDGEVEE